MLFIVTFNYIILLLFIVMADLGDKRYEPLRKIYYNTLRKTIERIRYESLWYGIESSSID